MRAVKSAPVFRGYQADIAGLAKTMMIPTKAATMMMSLLETNTVPLKISRPYSYSVLIYKNLRVS
jgi:hypothetical protein